ELVYSAESPYQNLYVTREGSVLTLRAGSLRARSSALDLDAPGRHVIEYTGLMMVGLGYVGELEKVLVLGLGGGTLTRTLRRYYPRSEITNVEIDGEVVRIARDHFGFRPDTRMALAVEDARRFLARTTDTYDLILLDAYHGDYIPFHLLTREFLELVRGRLNPGGAVVANTWSHQQLYHRESATYAAVFGSFDSYLGREADNRIVVARKDGVDLPYPELQRRMAETQGRKAFAELDLPTLLERHFDRELSWPADTPVLVDDYAPVNFLVGSEAR
ncbi:MAG: fused MFS/spermidine synthase, partial [Deferrisomatales bacterium]|nr:fused MFS/spermidine synthase [Deferrisomatales bacterium]